MKLVPSWSRSSVLQQLKIHLSYLVVVSDFESFAIHHAVQVALPNQLVGYYLSFLPVMVLGAHWGPRSWRSHCRAVLPESTITIRRQQRSLWYGYLVRQRRYKSLDFIATNLIGTSVRCRVHMRTVTVGSEGVLSVELRVP